MARLLGFTKTKATGAASSDQMLRIIEKAYLNRTKTGEYQTTQDVEGILEQLKRLPQSPDVMEKVADLENKKLQIGAKLNNILSEKNVFDTELQGGLDVAARQNFKNMRNLIGSYAAIYGDAAERYSSDVLGQINEQYGTAGKIPDDTLAYKKTLDNKAKFYAQLFNSYLVQDPKSGEFGALNTDGIAVTIDTNPTNGSINHIDIVPSGEVDGRNYMRTEVGVNVLDTLPNKKLPVFLRTNDVGVTSDGKTIRGSQLGNIKYTESMSEKSGGTTSSGQVLAPTKEVPGFWSKVNFFSDSPEETQSKSVDAIKQNGISFSSSVYNYNSQDIPNGNVLRMGNRLFYSTDKDDQILEISGNNSGEKQANLTKYLQGIGKDPSNVLPYFITNDYLTAPDGNSRIQGKVDENYFSPESSPGQPTSFQTNQPSPTAEVSSVQKPQAMSGFFGGGAGRGAEFKPVLSKNRDNKPNVAGETLDGKISTSDVIDKGKSFFRNKTMA